MNGSRSRTNDWWRFAISLIVCLLHKLGLFVKQIFLNTNGSLTVSTRHELMATLLALMDRQQISMRSEYVFLLSYIFYGIY